MSNSGETELLIFSSQFIFFQLKCSPDILIGEEEESWVHALVNI